ncbi:regulation of response to stimulus [Sparganum proliferum]
MFAKSDKHHLASPNGRHKEELRNRAELHFESSAAADSLQLSADQLDRQSTVAAAAATAAAAIATGDALDATSNNPLLSMTASGAQATHEFGLPLFVSTSSERSSSAPVSPVHPALGKDSDSVNFMKRPCPPLPNHPPPVQIARSTRIYRRYRKHGLRIGCPAFNSPYQSDVSQSAPSSPSTSCYDRLPLVKHAAALGETEDEYEKVISSAEYFHADSLRNDWASNFVNVDNRPMFGFGGAALQPHTDSFPRPVRRDHFSQQMRASQPTMMYDGNLASGQLLSYRATGDSELLLLLRRLGLEMLHPCLLQNGIASIDQLGTLTRQRLIDMGIFDAEARASLLTAAQLLTSTKLTSPLCPRENVSQALGGPAVYTAASETLAARLHNTALWANTSACTPYDSAGFYSGSNNNNNGTDPPPPPPQPVRDGGGGGTCWLYNGWQPALVDWPMGNVDLCCRRPEQANMEPKYCHLRSAAGLLERTPQAERRPSVEFKSSPPTQFDSLLGSRKFPIGAGNPLQSSETNGAGGGGPTPQRSLSLGPKPTSEAEIGRQSLLRLADDVSLRNKVSPVKQKWTKEQATAPDHPPSQLPKTPVGILRKTPTSVLTNGDQVVAVKRRPGSTPKSVKIDESSLHTNALAGGNGGKSGGGGGRVATANVLENQIAECLRLERIDLTKPPYSDENGESGIPLKLIERYASEAGQEFNTIAVTLEVIRERQLREAGLPVISNLEEIRSQRYLNCNGIKTDDLFGFLTSIGLPMYAECLSTALNGQPPTPGNLMALSDAHLVYSLGIPVSHVSRIRQEAALIPKGLLSANPSGPANSLLLHQKSSSKSRTSRAGGCGSSVVGGGVTVGPSGAANEKHRSAGGGGGGGGGLHHHKKHSAARNNTSVLGHDPNGAGGGGLCERALLPPAGEGLTIENLCDKV